MATPDTVDPVLKWLGVSLQLLGVALTLFGLAVVHSWLERATAAASEAKRGIARWWAIRKEAANHWWRRLLGKPIFVQRFASDQITLSDSATATVRRARVDRATVSDRDWLTFLDERVESIFVLLDQASRARAEEVDQWNRRLTEHRDELREEILLATRQGWQLIVCGLLSSAIGIVLTAVA
jgi:hypothetical protein